MWKRRGQDEQCARFIAYHWIISVTWPWTASSSRLRLTFNTTLPDAWIWVLLTCHVVDTRQMSDYISLRVEVEEEGPMAIEPVNEQILAKEVS